MTKKRPAQSRKKAEKPDPAAQFAEEFLKQWQAQWAEMMQKGAMPPPEALGLPPGFIPLQQIGPMGLMAPMGAVALANLKLLQELQDRVGELEKQLHPASRKKK
jgi:hypothetical protein